MKQIYYILILSFLAIATVQSSFAAAADPDLGKEVAFAAAPAGAGKAASSDAVLEEEARAIVQICNACDQACGMVDSIMASKVQYIDYLSSLAPADATAAEELCRFKEMIAGFTYTGLKDDLRELKTFERKKLMDKEIVENCSSIRYFLIERNEYLEKAKRDYKNFFVLYPDALGVYEAEYSFIENLGELFLGCLSEEYKTVYRSLNIDHVSAELAAGSLLPGVYQMDDRVVIISAKGIRTILPLQEFTKVPTIEFKHTRWISLKLASGITVEIVEESKMREFLDSIESIGSRMEPTWCIGAIDLYNKRVEQETREAAESAASIAASEASIAESKASIAAIEAESAAAAEAHRVRMAAMDAEEKAYADAVMDAMKSPEAQRLKKVLEARNAKKGAASAAAGCSEIVLSEEARAALERELCGGDASVGRRRKSGKGRAAPASVAASAASSGASAVPTAAAEGAERARVAAERAAAAEAEAARVEAERVARLRVEAEERRHLNARTMELFQQQRDAQESMERTASARTGLNPRQKEALAILLRQEIDGAVQDIHALKWAPLISLLEGLGFNKGDLAGEGVSLHKFHGGGSKENPGMGWNDRTILMVKLAARGFTEDVLRFKL